MKVVALGDVAAIKRSTVDPSSLDDDVTYLGLEHIERGGRIRGSQRVGDAGLASTKFRFTSEHVLMGKLRPNLGKIARPSFDGVCSTDILPIRPGHQLDRAYLAHFLAQPSMIAFAASRASGANLPRLSPTVLASFEIPLPPLAEQRRIAAILDQADELRAKRRRTLALHDDLTQSIFLDMFGDPVANQMGWARARFGEVVPKVTNGKSPNCEARPARSDEWGVLKLGAVTYGTFDEGENKAYLANRAGMEGAEVRAGDLLMTRKNTRQLVGAVALVHDVRPRLLLPDLIFRLEVDERLVIKGYLQPLLMNERKRTQVRDLSSGSAASMPNISKARLESLPVELPPIELQREFVRRVESARAVRRIAEADQLDELFASLQSRAFAGRL